MITYGTQETPWGRLGVEVTEQGLHRLDFDVPLTTPISGIWAEVFADYIAGKAIPLHLTVDLSDLPPFTRQVLVACRKIPFGCTMSYAQLARAIARPTAARAVGQALSRNPVPVVIPCHRVVGTHGQLTGFAGGLEWKRRLLLHEGVSVVQESIPLSSQSDIAMRLL